MTRAFAIRAAVPDDAVQLKRCMEAAYAPYQQRMGGQRLPPMEVDYRLEIEHYPSWIAASGQRVAGGLLMMFADHQATIANIAVDPQFQGRGIGGMLMTFAESEARLRHFGELSLATHPLLTENLSLYTHLGWQEIERSSTRVLLRKLI